jgi:hypothetical protein
MFTYYKTLIWNLCGTESKLFDKKLWNGSQMQYNANADTVNPAGTKVLWWHNRKLQYRQYQTTGHFRRLFHRYASYCCPPTVFIVLQGVSPINTVYAFFLSPCWSLQTTSSSWWSVGHEVPRCPLSFLLGPHVFLMTLSGNISIYIRIYQSERTFLHHSIKWQSCCLVYSTGW